MRYSRTTGGLWAPTCCPYSISISWTMGFCFLVVSQAWWHIFLGFVPMELGKSKAHTTQPACRPNLWPWLGEEAPPLTTHAAISVAATWHGEAIFYIEVPGQGGWNSEFIGHMDHPPWSLPCSTRPVVSLCSWGAKYAGFFCSAARLQQLLATWLMQWVVPLVWWPQGLAADVATCT